MSALGAVARGIFVTGFFLFTTVPMAIAHTDLELQIEALSQQLAIRPDNADLLLKRGDLYRRHLDFELAAQDFSAARAIEPANPLVDYYQGRLALETGEAGQAQALLSRYIQNAPDHAAAWVMLGRAELILNSPSNAANSFAQAIRSGTTPSPELYILQALALVADHRPERGLQVLDDGLMRWPGQVNLVGLGCDISLAENLPERAQDYLRDVPDQLLKIDRWRQRIDRAACLSNQDMAQTQREQCLSQSGRDLEEQLNRLTQP